jgi:hypothetical protein
MVSLARPEVLAAPGVAIMSAMALPRAVALTLCLAVVPTLSSCGGNSQPRAVTRTATASVQAHTFIPPPANAIVTMRRFSTKGLTWQSIYVQPDGKALLTSLIGETAGAPHRPFQLSADQLATLRRLITAARSARPGPSRPGLYQYSLHIAGERLMSLEGPMPRALAKLVNFLGHLMLIYCC